MSTRTNRGGDAAKPLRTLIADDEPRARQYLEKLLGEHDSLEVVGTARSGAEALQRVAELRPDVVFLDIHMPDLSGLEVARHLRGAGPPPVDPADAVTVLDVIDAARAGGTGRRRG